MWISSYALSTNLVYIGQMYHDSNMTISSETPNHARASCMSTSDEIELALAR